MSSIRKKIHRYGHVPNRNKFVFQNWRFSLLYKIHLMDKPNSWLSKHLSKKGKIPNKVYDSSGTDICYVLFFAHWRHALLKKNLKEYLKLLSISWSRMLDETHTKKEEEEEVSKILRMDYQNSHLWIPQILIMAHLMA